MSPFFKQKIALITLLLVVVFGLGRAIYIQQSIIKAFDEIDTSRHLSLSVNPDYTQYTKIEVSGEDLDAYMTEIEEESVEMPMYAAEPNSTPFENDFELLAHLINAEAGAPWVEDEVLYAVGSVVLNRMESDEFPETMEEIIYQSGQYAVVNNGRIAEEPTERSYAIAADLMQNGSTLPEEVVFQANFKQGTGTYQEIQGVYFCYKEKPETLESASNPMFIDGTYDGYEDYIPNEDEENGDENDDEI